MISIRLLLSLDDKLSPLGNGVIAGGREIFLKTNRTDADDRKDSEESPRHRAVRNIDPIRPRLPNVDVTAGNFAVNCDTGNNNRRPTIVSDPTSNTQII